MPTELLKRFRRSDDGAVAVVVSLLLTVLLGFVALGVDMAYLYRERAQLQSASDLTAVSAMAAVRGDPTARAQSVVQRNPAPRADLRTLETGRYLRNPAIAAAARFTPLPQGHAGVNAVRVVLADDAPLHFAVVLSDQTHVTLDRTALATRTGAASFALDSHIANLDGAALNTLLAQEFGIDAAISAGGIDVLSRTSVDLADVLAGLPAASGPGPLNPAAVFDRAVDTGALISALQSVLPGPLAADLDGLARAASGGSIAVATLVGGIDTDLGLTATDMLAQIDITALEVIQAVIAAEVAQGTATLDTDLNVTGVIEASATLTAGEPPARSGWVALGEEGVQLSRAALRLSTQVDIEPTVLQDLGVGIDVAQVSLPLHLDVAGASATLEHIHCDAADPGAVAARFSTGHDGLPYGDGTSVAALSLGRLADTSLPINPANLDFADILVVDLRIAVPLLPDLVIPGVTIQARSHVTAGQSRQETVTFTHADIAAGDTVRTFGSGDILTGTLNDLLSPANTEIRIKPEDQGLVAGLAGPLLSDLLAALPAQVLATLAAPVDQVLDAQLAQLGLEVGAGELTLTGHHCERIRLVR